MIKRLLIKIASKIYKHYRVKHIEFSYHDDLIFWDTHYKIASAEENYQCGGKKKLKLELHEVGLKDERIL